MLTVFCIALLLLKCTRLFSFIQEVVLKGVYNFILYFLFGVYSQSVVIVSDSLVRTFSMHRSIVPKTATGKTLFAAARLPTAVLEFLCLLD